MKLKNHLLFPVLCYKDHLHTKQINLFKKKLCIAEKRNPLWHKTKGIGLKYIIQIKKIGNVNAII